VREWIDTGILREELSEEEYEFSCTSPVGLGFCALACWIAMKESRS